jgi:hypothetical protein
MHLIAISPQFASPSKILICEAASLYDNKTDMSDF